MTVDKRISKTNLAILNAFVTLAQKMPLEKITITALAKEAHISRKTFYDRFSSMDELINALRLSIVTQLKGTFIPRIDENLNDDEISKFLDFIVANKELIKILNTENDTFLQVTIKERHQDFEHYLVKNAGYSERSAKQITPWLITYYFQGIRTLINGWLFDDNDLTKEEMIKLIILLFKSKILPEVKKK